MPVIRHLESLVLLAQPAGNAQGGGMEGLLRGPLLPFVFLGVLFYFMLFRPERRKRAEHTNMLNNLKKNDRVVTIGGIHGTLVNVQQGAEEVTLRVDEGTNTRLRILRSAISRVLTADKSGEGSESS